MLNTSIGSAGFKKIELGVVVVKNSLKAFILVEKFLFF